MLESENKLERDISELIIFLTQFSLEEICIKAFYTLQSLISNRFNSILIAPEQQINYILDLAVNSARSDQPKNLCSENWDMICSLANKIFLSYQKKYESDMIRAPEEARSKIFITMINYMGNVYNGKYFQTVEQLSNKINNLFFPFSVEINNHFGLSLDELLAISNTAITSLQGNLDTLMALKKSHEQYKELISQGVNHDIAIKQCIELNSQPHIWVTVNQLQNQKLSLEKIGIYLSMFSQSQSIEKENIVFFPGETRIKPLIKLSHGNYFLISGNHLFQKLHMELEKAIIQDEKTKTRYEKHKAKLLEINTLENLRKIFGPDAQYYESVYEKADSQYEHDLLIIYKRNLLIVECKTTPIPKQFRDVNKAYPKIFSRFKDSIGSGLNQSLNLKRLILNQNVTELYNKKGTPYLKIVSNKLDNIFCICVTEQNEGILASNLSLLFKDNLEKKYPYCINSQALTQLAELSKKLKITPSLFIKFLQSREKLHEHVIADDELDYWEYFLKHKNFNNLIKNKDFLSLSTPQISMFDRAYLEKTHPETEFFPKRDFAKVGRNDPCPCESGKKYKKCCSPQNAVKNATENF